MIIRYAPTRETQRWEQLSVITNTKGFEKDTLMNISFVVGLDLPVRAYSLNIYIHNEGKCPARPYKQITTRMSPDKRFNVLNNSPACAFWVIVFPCKTTPWNDQILYSLRNVHDDGKILVILFGGERLLCIFYRIRS